MSRTELTDAVNLTIIINRSKGGWHGFFKLFSHLGQIDQTTAGNVRAASFRRSIPRGTVLHNGSADSMGLLLICSGQLRAYILSEQGREITIYRLFERDICLFSASCMMRNIQFDITIEAEKDTEFWVIPPNVYRSVMEQSAPVANYTNELMSSRFSEVMWLVEQILWKSFDQRLAAFLWRKRD
jgi:CRP/FNR family transcriptional regulator